jgi:hypothetical protein
MQWDLSDSPIFESPEGSSIESLSDGDNSEKWTVCRHRSAPNLFGRPDPTTRAFGATAPVSGEMCEVIEFLSSIYLTHRAGWRLEVGGRIKEEYRGGVSCFSLTCHGGSGCSKAD